MGQAYYAVADLAEGPRLSSPVILGTKRTTKTQKKEKPAE